MTQTPAPTTASSDPSGFFFPDPLVVHGTPAGDYYDAMMRGMTHKLNNFLAVIQGFSSLILMSDNLETSVRENLDQMKEATNGAKMLAERILSARGTVRLTPQPMQLKEYIPLIEGNLRTLFHKLGVPLQITIAPGVPAVLSDNARLREVFSELLNNAAEAVHLSGRPGSAALDVLPPGQVPGGRPGCVDIFIRNTGATLSPEKVREMFRPFQSTKDSKHPGIGLTIVHMLCSQMGIRIGAKCEGDTVTIWLSVPTV